jgi:hypothetical protein
VDRLNKNLKLRALASKGGAFVAFAIYMGVVLVLGVLGLQYADWPAWFAILMVPANLFIHSPSDTLILGVSSNLILASLAMYMALGYLIDWLHDPYK